MNNPQKTYKREVAMVMLLFLAILGVWGIWEPEAKVAAQFFTLPIFTFAGGAFAMDAAFKQGGFNSTTKKGD